MERLTHKTEKGPALVMGVYKDEAAARADLVERYKEAMAKLAAYEDTELEPEEVAVLEAKNEVLAQENDRLKAENKRLHEENFWLTGHKGQEKEEEKPLTLEELRELDGQPVWVSYEDRTEWGIVKGTIIYLPAGEYCSIREEGFGEYWKAYRHPPKEANE